MHNKQVLSHIQSYVYKTFKRVIIIGLRVMNVREIQDYVAMMTKHQQTQVTIRMRRRSQQAIQLSLIFGQPLIRELLFGLEFGELSVLKEVLMAIREERPHIHALTTEMIQAVDEQFEKKKTFELEVQMTEKIHEQYEELEQELTKIEETGNSKKSKNGEEEESLEIAAKIKQKVEPTIQLLGNLLKATGKGMKMLSYLWH